MRGTRVADIWRYRPRAEHRSRELRKSSITWLYYIGSSLPDCPDKERRQIGGCKGFVTPNCSHVAHKPGAGRSRLVCTALVEPRRIENGLHQAVGGAQSFEKRFPADDYQTSGLCDVVGDRRAVRLGADAWSRLFV